MFKKKAGLSEISTTSHVNSMLKTYARKKNIIEVLMIQNNP